MKLAFAGKGGAGKTSLSAWLGDYLARKGENVWLVDADTALSLGQASGLGREALPEPLISRRDLIESRIRAAGDTMLNLSPEVGDLPELLSVALPLGAPALLGRAPGKKRLLLMGAVNSAGGGCACDANALLKALLAHLVLEREEWVLVDLEAGVEHLGRGTAMFVDGLIVVSEPSLRSLETAAEVSRMAAELGVTRQILALNRAGSADMNRMAKLPANLLEHLPSKTVSVPYLDVLREKQLESGSVLGLGPVAQPAIDAFCAGLLENLLEQNSLQQHAEEHGPNLLGSA